MSNSRIPSPARSLGPPVTPRRYKPRTTRSVGSPARSTASGRLSNIVDQFKESNKESFAFSPLSKTVLSDNTEIEMPRRKSWWKRVENSRDVFEVLENEKLTDPVNVLEEFDLEVLTQEKNDEEKNYTIDLPESSDNESINSIVLPQRKLFIQKENMPQKKFRDAYTKDLPESSDNESINSIVLTQHKLFIQKENMPQKIFGDFVGTSKDNETHKDKTINVRTKNLFGKTSQKNKPVFPSALLNISPEKSLKLPAEAKGQAKSLFGRPATKRKNIFAEFIVSESEDEIPEILPKRFTFRKPSEPSRRSSNTSSITTDIEMDDWKLLPSSTMVEHQLEAELITPGKRARLSKLSEAKESTNTDSTKQSNKSMSSKNKSYVLSPAKNQEVEKSVSNKQDSPKNDLENTASLKQISTLNKSTKNFDNSKNIHEAQGIPVNEEAKEKSTVNKTYNINKTITKSQIVENKQDDAVNVHEPDEITRENIVESEPAIDQQKEDEEILLTYEDSDPEDIEGNNDAAKHVIDDKTKTICVDNRLSKVSEYMDNIEKELSTVVGAETNNILQMETPMPNKSVQSVKRVVEETPDSRFEGRKSSNNTTKSFENNQKDYAKEDNEQEVEEVLNEDQADENDDNNQELKELDEDEAEASKEIEIDEEEEVEHEESQEMESNREINESENQEEIEVSHDDEIENNDETNADTEEEDEEADDEQQNSQDEVEVDAVKASDDEMQALNDELQPSEDEVQNESLEVEEENQNKSDDQDEEQNESQQIEDDDEEQNSQEMVEDEDHGESQETENEENDSQEMEIDNSEEVQEAAEDETDQQEIDPQQSAEEIDGNVTHDTTGRNRKKRETNTPEAILHNASNVMDSFTNKGPNTSIRKTKSILKNFTIRPSIAPPRESTGLSDGTKNSSAEGSGWDSHRTTRKTLRQTFGKDFTPRKSLRALVMEKSAGRHRQTQAELELRLHQANSTELPNEQSEIMENEEAVSDNGISKQTRQATLEMYLQKVNKENMEFKEKIEQQVKNSLKSNPGTVDILNFRPYKPIRRAKSPQAAPKVKRIKPSLISLKNMPPELVADLKYKPPKRFNPGNAAWITKRLYKFLEDKLEPKYDYKARIRAEKLVETLYNFVRDIRRVRVAPAGGVAALKREMARLGVVTTHFEFYNFFNDYLPREVIIKVVPDIVNAIPLPREGVFEAITV